MIDVEQFRAAVVGPALRHLGLWSPAAENLVVGTALAESGLTYLTQLGGGPALGPFQMEPATHADIWDNWLRYRPDLGWTAAMLRAGWPDGAAQLRTNWLYAAAMCRLHYRRAPEPLPDADDVVGLAYYWKEHYNTRLGAGVPTKFVDAYNRHGHAAAPEVA